MKRSIEGKSYIFAIRTPLILLSTIGLLSSCSWISSRRSLFGEEGEAQESSEVTSVPKNQYDQLMNKYEALLKERRGEGDSGSEVAQTPVIEEDPMAVMDQLKNVKEPTKEEALNTTVDMFREREKKEASDLLNPQNGMAPLSTGSINSSLIEDHITKVRSAESLVVQNKYDAALNLIKELEASPVRQVAVRAKYLMGEMLFKQGEFDLALQVYEEILEKQAFSGLVIKTLGRLIVCSEKLKLPGKQEKYYSILHDFFENQT